MKTCFVDRCDNISYGNTLYCTKHYQRIRKHGNADYINPIHNHPDTCNISGCNNKYYGKGYCNKHYQKLMKYGDPLFFKAERHGMKSTSEYNTWCAMNQRCADKNKDNYHRYGGRGITVCDRWKKSFVNFYKDMGPKPFPRAEIDREDNDGNYEPGNCRWTTRAHNMHNTSKTRLDMDIANKIREEYSREKTTQISLSKKYNLDKGTVFFIVHNKQWKDSTL